MKSKEFIKKYCLDGGELPGYRHNEFILDFSSDFLRVIDEYSGVVNLAWFTTIIKQYRQKWDSIFKNARGDYEKLWKYFFATVVAPTRDNLCKPEMEKKRQEQLEKKKEYEQRKEWKKQMFEDFERMENEWFQERFNIFNSILSNLMGSFIPKDSFSLLGIGVDSSIDEIKSAFRSKALTSHPDKGGDRSEFEHLIECRDKCIAYASNRSQQ